MYFNNIQIFLITLIALLFVSTKAEILMAGQCNEHFRIGLRTLNSSAHPQRITYHGKSYKLFQCLGILDRSNSVQCSFIYKECEDERCDRPDFRYYTFTFKKHVKGSTHTQNHHCVISRVIGTLDDPQEVKTAEMGHTVLVESKFKVDHEWKYSYDEFSVTEYKYLDYNNM
ncbi:hypothetical protein PIROE2DRAFT_61350 [Piromyces sp. E2]|nr:hypothetical protein PIROE2DRAFT_61350 [Piromyces sp. E2]|eukprot:OUM63327.1 hypothetical protein PIROE2DRAFT_61350 [Piromyces sp. E2]